MAALSPKERSSALNDLTQDELEALMEACTAHEKAAIIAAMTPEARCAEMSKLEVWEQDAVVACASPEEKVAIVAAMEPGGRALMVRKIVPSDIEVTLSLLCVSLSMPLSLLCVSSKLQVLNLLRLSVHPFMSSEDTIT